MKADRSAPTWMNADSSDDRPWADRMTIVQAAKFLGLEEGSLRSRCRRERLGLEDAPLPPGVDRRMRAVTRASVERSLEARDWAKMK